MHPLEILSIIATVFPLSVCLLFLLIGSTGPSCPNCCFLLPQLLLLTSFLCLLLACIILLFIQILCTWLTSVLGWVPEKLSPFSSSCVVIWEAADISTELWSCSRSSAWSTPSPLKVRAPCFLCWRSKIHSSGSCVCSLSSCRINNLVFDFSRNETCVYFGAESVFSKVELLSLQVLSSVHGQTFNIKAVSANVSDGFIPN